jgi:predicted extracellular nuclease
MERSDGNRVDEDGTMSDPDLTHRDASNRETIRIATYNVRRFFDTVCQSNRCEQDDFEAAPSQAEFDFRLDLVSDALQALDADLLILQEIENMVGLDAIAERYGHTGYFREIGETGSAGSLDVAVLGVGDVLEVKGHRERRLTKPDGRSTSFSREFLEVHVSYGGRRIILFSAHFKAKRNDDPGRRFAEAEAAREIVGEVADAHPDALIILGGDLNDDPDSSPMQEITGDERFHLVSEDRPLEDVWTYQYFSDRTAIDHLILVGDDRGAYVSQSATAVRDVSGGLGGSDHAGLRAEFYLD